MSTEEMRIYTCKRKIIYNIATVEDNQRLVGKRQSDTHFGFRKMYHVIQLDHVCVSNLKASKTNVRWSSPLSYNSMFDLHGHSRLDKTANIMMMFNTYFNLFFHKNNQSTLQLQKKNKFLQPYAKSKTTN